MKFLNLVATLVLLSATCSPADATEGEPVPSVETQTHQLKNPWVAASLGWAVTGGLVASEQFLELPLVRGNPSPFATIVSLSSVGFGAGHFYAGDPLRGTLVSLGGPVAVIGTGFIFQSISQALTPPCTSITCGGMMDVNPFLTGWLLATLGYGAWASWDAYQTAIRRNEGH